MFKGVWVGAWLWWGAALSLMQAIYCMRCAAFDSRVIGVSCILRTTIGRQGRVTTCAYPCAPLQLILLDSRE